ncbi:putative PELOTA like protein [Blattamonas nauphoetae]|uniref:PELOTA like protein n=1 Tax=Blattamonas nauphoetae TaxID=2049346 RepID=A0ABQ9XNI0_9EUKA|nr:putative PELOTA like protein [Blattamonas nauphoetae]
MKISNRKITRNGSGSVILTPEYFDDFWHAYNLIQKGDLITTKTTRRVRPENAGISTESRRIEVKVELLVTKLEFDPKDMEMRIRGSIKQCNEPSVSLGVSHTVSLEIRKPIGLQKEYWDDFSLDKLREAKDGDRSPDMCIVVMQEGLAGIYIQTENVLLKKSKVQLDIPRKGSNKFSRDKVSPREKGMFAFFDAVKTAIETHIDLENVGCVILASPGFVKDDFWKYLEASQDKLSKGAQKTQITAYKSKFVFAHCSSAHHSAVSEVLNDASVKDRVRSARTSDAVSVMAKFFDILGRNDKKVCYGEREVQAVSSLGAIEHLLISEDKIRKNNPKDRQVFLDLIRQVKDKGGEAHLLSDSLSIGNQLAQLGGIAAILRYEVNHEQYQIGTEDEAEMAGVDYTLNCSKAIWGQDEEDNDETWDDWKHQQTDEDEDDDGRDPGQPSNEDLLDDLGW